METSPPATVLILARHRPTARRWATMLGGAGLRVCQAPEQSPEGMTPELIVTDRDPAEADPAGVGVVRIGVSGPCDVLLPEDFTPRELCLACGLLAQVVRLRCRQRRGAELSRRLAQEALTDPLTGLPNRRAWDQALAERLAAAPDQPGRLCVAILDLDLFKRVNDAHGHPAGDEVLRATGRALREGLRQDDFVARLGGDEFGLLLRVSDAASALRVVDRVRQTLPTALARAPTHIVTASAGYHVLPPFPSAEKESGASGCSSPLPPAGEGPGVRERSSPLPSAGEGPGVRAIATPPPCPEDLFTAADAALRTAKQQGRDRTEGP